jgi:hypothetical protein
MSAELDQASLLGCSVNPNFFQPSAQIRDEPVGFFLVLEAGAQIVSKPAYRLS